MSPSYAILRSLRSQTLPSRGCRFPFHFVSFMKATMLAEIILSRKSLLLRHSTPGRRAVKLPRMTRTEQLLAELIALPSVNPAFVPPDGTSARQARQPHPFAGEQRVADFCAVTAAHAGLDIEFQSILPGRSNLIARLLPRNNIRQTILLAPHLD